MSIRIVVFSAFDLAVDSAAVAGTLMEACNNRSRRYRLRGVCPVDEQVYFVLEPRNAAESPEAYVIVPLSDTTEAGVTAVLNERWSAGFSTLGTVRLGDDACVMVFAKPMDRAG